MSAIASLFPGYNITETLHETSSTLVYRGLRELDNVPIVIKLLRAEYPTLREITRLRHEYTIAREIDHPGVIKPYDLLDYNNGLALVLEDFGGQSLRQMFGGCAMPLPEFLGVAIQIAETLATLHAQYIIHKDLKPHNIIYNPVTQHVKLIDFSIASRLLRENVTSHTPTALEGTLSYMSPEQTGRMNRGIDYRTDLYSLGVTFYELLTGQLPFQSDDPLELVHSHIAKTPISPHQIKPDIPIVLSDMVMKLLAKMAEDRYQSAYGLKSDLARCLHQLKTNGTIGSFPVGQDDLRGQFYIPEKLYGREHDIATLLAAFDRVAGTTDGGKSYLNATSPGCSELVLVAGYSGIGKSSLVNEIHKPMARCARIANVRQRGYFISGKFDQFKRNIPYSALVQAFRELMRQLLTESEAQIAHWSEQLSTALGKNAQVIVDVIPEVEWILGKQPPAPKLGTTESQNRFNLIVRQFVHVIATPDHPLVLFLDDLQWADSASLQLIQLLMSDRDSQGLLLIGAYRNNEVSPAHPLMVMLDVLQKNATPIQTITLQNLSTDCANQLISDTLHCNLDETLALTSLLMSKTQGNPFFLTQLLKALHDEGLLTFNYHIGCWEWTIEDIQNQSLSDNVVEFMVGKLLKLPKPTQNALRLAACIGNVFDLQTLATIAETSLRSITLDLWAAIQDELIIPLSDSYKIPLVHDQDLDGALMDDLNITCRFLHDRVQQAAYALITDEEKPETHLRVGRLVLKNTDPEAIDEKLFDIVNAFNIGIRLVTDSQEQQDLIRLNLLAGQKAKAAAAYEPALKYLQSGISLLTEDSWNHHYELTLSLYSEAAEVAYLTTDFNRSEQLVDIIQHHAANCLDHIKAYELRIQFYMAQFQMTRAIETGLGALKLLNVPLVQAKTQEDCLIDLPDLNNLSAIPEMVDPQQLAAMRILSVVTSPAYQTQPDMFKALVLTQVNYCRQYGHSALASFAYVAYGWLMCGRLGNVEVGYQAGKIALALLDQFNARSFKCSIYQLFESFIRPWKESLRATFAPLLEAIHIGQETGAFEYAGYCTINYCTHLFLSGEPLDELAQKQAHYINLLTEFKQEFQISYTQLLRQLTLNLRTPMSQVDRLVGESFDETDMLPHFRAANNRQSLFASYVAKLILSYVFGHYNQALQNAELAETYADSGAGLALSGAYCFYQGLTLLALCINTSEINETEQQQSQYLTQAIALQERLKHWADHAPMNYQHKYDLIVAEMARVQGYYLEAMDAYDRAIKGARQERYLQDEALANERAAEFYLAISKEKIAHVYLTDAYYAYIRWGAVAKVKALEKQYPELLKSIIHRDSTTLTQTTTKSTTVSTSASNSCSNSLDLLTVVKASQTLSSEIILCNLLEKFMTIAMENAGAQRGLFLVKQADQWSIEAESHLDQQITVLQSAPVTVEMIPSSMINYVSRTREYLVLNNAIDEERFASDPYILNNQPKSILCFPVLHHTKLIGILYLENNLTSGAFTPDRLEILKLLMAQIAISLENAMLYGSLQTYSHELETKSKELELKNQALQRSESREREKSHELKTSLNKLQQTQAQLVQTEKISSLGQLVAGVAHEVNNPLGFISGNLKYVQDYISGLTHLLRLYQTALPNPPLEIQQTIEDIELDYVLEDLPQILSSMHVGTDRIREIMSSLRKFSRMDTDQKQPADIHEGLNSTLLILRHRLKATPERSEIELDKQYGNLPLVACYAGQLNQVFMNLIANAIDALEESMVRIDWKSHSMPHPVSPAPCIRICTEVVDSDRVAIRIADNGPGIAPEAQQRLFQPFFTTKTANKGTGLGLSISHQIITEKHGGKLTCNSVLGQGTEFVIEIPIEST